jgi:hypothetical protein
VVYFAAIFAIIYATALQPLFAMHKAWIAKFSLLFKSFYFYFIFYNCYIHYYLFLAAAPIVGNCF